MKASLIVPTYNRADYLAEALKSCLSQTEEDYEIIVVDDGSTDSTPQLMEYFLKLSPKISYYRKPNGGPSSAVNYGAKRAKSDILLIADADDVQLPNKVAVGIEVVQGVDYGYTGYNYCNPKGEFFEYIPPLPVTKESIIACKCASGESLAMWKKTWQRVPWREDLRVNNDLGWLIDAYNNDLTFNYIDVATFNYRMLSDGMSYGRKKEVDALTKELLKELK